MEAEGRKRVIIENVKPEIDCGRFPIKRVVEEKVIVMADIFSDGHDSISARLLYRGQKDKEWREVPLKLIENDRWRGEFVVEEVGIYYYTVEGWVDYFKTWQRDLKKKWDAGHDLKVDLLIGASLVEETSKRASAEDRKKLIRFAEVLKGKASKEKIVSTALGEELIELMDRYPDKRFAIKYGKELPLVVDRDKALFSTWYELFPRSCTTETGRHGTLKDCEGLLPEISRMGFDILYLPPIHPIGRTNRKGKNNVLQVNPDDVGSPWVILSKEGGHKAVHPQLGTLKVSTDPSG